MSKIRNDILNLSSDNLSGQSLTCLNYIQSKAQDLTSGEEELESLYASYNRYIKYKTKELLDILMESANNCKLPKKKGAHKIWVVENQPQDIPSPKDKKKTTLGTPSPAQPWVKQDIQKREWVKTHLRTKEKTETKAINVYKIAFSSEEKQEIEMFYRNNKRALTQFLWSKKAYNNALKITKASKYKYGENFSARVYPYYLKAKENNTLRQMVVSFSQAEKLKKEWKLVEFEEKNDFWILDDSIVKKSKTQNRKWLLYATPEVKETITEIIQEFQKWAKDVFGQDTNIRVFLNSLLRPQEYFRWWSTWSPHKRGIWGDIAQFDFEFFDGKETKIITSSKGRIKKNINRNKTLGLELPIKINKQKVLELQSILYQILLEFDQKGRIIFTREWTHPHITITPERNKLEQVTDNLQQGESQKQVSPEVRDGFTQKYEQLQEKYRQTRFTALGNAQIQWFFTMLDDPDIENKQQIFSAIESVMEEQEKLINDSEKNQEMAAFFFFPYSEPNEYKEKFLRHAMISFYDRKVDWIADTYNRFYRDIPKWENKTSFLKKNKIHPLKEMEQTIDPREKKIYEQYDWYHVFIQALDTMRLFPKAKKQFLDTLDEYFKVEMDIAWNNAFIDTIWDCIHDPNYHITKLSQALREIVEKHTSLLDKQKQKYEKELFGDTFILWDMPNELDTFLWEFTIQAQNFEYRMNSQDTPETYDRDSILYYTFSHLHRTDKDIDGIKKLLKKNNIDVSTALSADFTPKDRGIYIDYQLDGEMLNLKRLHAEWKVTTKQIWENLGGGVGFQVYRNDEMWLSNAIDLFGLPNTLVDSIRKILGRSELTPSQIKNIEKMLQYFLFIESNSNRWYRTKWWYNVANYAQISSAKWYLQYLHRNGKYRRNKWLTNSFETALRRVNQSGMMDEYPDLFSMYATSWTFQEKWVKESVTSFEDRVQRVQNPMLLSAEEQMVLFFCDIVWKNSGKEILEKIVDGNSKQVIKMYAKLHHTDEREKQTQKLAQEAYRVVYQ